MDINYTATEEEMFNYLLYTPSVHVSTDMLFINITTYVRQRPLSMLSSSPPSSPLYIFVNTFARWWLYWPKHVTIRCKNRLFNTKPSCVSFCTNCDVSRLHLTQRESGENRWNPPPPSLFLPMNYIRHICVWFVPYAVPSYIVVLSNTGWGLRPLLPAAGQSKDRWVDVTFPLFTTRNKTRNVRIT
jgi:hypothetical protein